MAGKQTDGGSARYYSKSDEETLIHKLDKKKFEGEFFSHRPYLDVPPYRNLDYNHRMPPWKMETHSHEYWQIFFVLSGSCYIECEEQLFHLHTGQASILPPNTVHRMWADEDYTQLGAAVQPHSGDAHGIAAFLDEEIHLHTVVDYSARIELCQRACLLFRENKKSAQMILCAQMDVILLYLFDILERDGSNAFLLRLDQYLTANLAERITVADAANYFHFSISSLERLCRRYYGCGLLTRLGQLRMDRACMLLQTTMYPIKDIAATVGFRNPAHFTKVFKRCTGVTPEVFRADS